MKVIALAALVATTEAALGDDCYYDDTVCNAPQYYCATWVDSQYGDMASCEVCDDGQGQMIADSYGDLVEYVCPPESYPVVEEETEEETTEEEAQPAPEPAPAAEEEGSSKLVAGAAALIAAVSMMA